MTRFLLLVALIFGSCNLANGNDLVSQVFESGSLAASNSPGDGWKFWNTSGNDLAEIGSTGRTFQTGTSSNDEALFITPYNDAGEATTDLEGAVWTSSTPIDLNLTSDKVLYLVTETFSDTATFSDQFFKLDVRFGSAGDGGGYAGFDSSRDRESSVNSNWNTEATNSNRQGRVGGGNGGSAEFDSIKYDGDSVQPGAADENTFLDRTYVMNTVWRPLSGGGNHAEMKSSDGVNPDRFRQGRDGEGDPATRPLKVLPDRYPEIDRITVHHRRHVGLYEDDFLTDELLNGFGGHTGQATGVDFADTKIGIKSLRIGVTDVTDINLDGVTDAADRQIVVDNQGVSTANTTLFNGDIDNDGDVDGDDLAFFGSPGDFDNDGDVDGSDFLVWQQTDGTSTGLTDWQTNYGPGAISSLAAVPEPTTVAHLAFAALCSVMQRRRS